MTTNSPSLAVQASPVRAFSRAELVACIVGGALLLFIGARFLLVETVAADAFGVSLDHTTSYAHIKGIRDAFTGVIIAVFALLGDRRATGLVLLLGSSIPVVDGFQVLSVHGFDVPHLSIHWGTAVVCSLLGGWLLKTPRARA